MFLKLYFIIGNLKFLMIMRQCKFHSNITKHFLMFTQNIDFIANQRNNNVDMLLNTNLNEFGDIILIVIAMNFI